MLIGEQTHNSKALTTKPIRILLVSNNANDSVLISQLLSQVKSTTYVLNRAESLKQGITAVARNSCDMVLLNYYWDHFKIGGRFVKKAKSVNSALPIIVFSAETEPLVEQQIIGIGASDYLTLNELNARTLDRTIRFALQRKSIEQRLENLANYDFLTQLPNRMLFQDRLRQFIHAAERERHQFALMVVDLNDFKKINDSYGHEVGDELLKVFSQRLKRAIRRNDTVARVGGDEFMLLFAKVVSQELTQQLVYKILQELQKPAEINGHILPMPCSIGIAIYPGAGTDIETLQRNADIAMYNAKLEKGSTYCFYNSTLDMQSNSQEELNLNFVSALANNQIGLYFNPRIECATDRICAIEVNPYWEHPHKGLLEYENFNWRQLDPAMSSRFIEWLLVTSLEYFKELSVMSDTKLIFNIDFKDLLFPSFSQMTSSKLKRYGIKGNQIEFDISHMQDAHHSRSMLSLCVTDLERLGVRFGMNNFGSNNLPLLTLDTIPIDVLKLDSRFVEDLTGDADSQLVKAFIDFAHSLGKKIVIEGKHNELPIETIKALGFDYYKSIFSVELESLAQMQKMLEKPAVLFDHYAKP